MATPTGPRSCKIKVVQNFDDKNLGKHLEELKDDQLG